MTEKADVARSYLKETQDVIREASPDKAARLACAWIDLKCCAVDYDTGPVYRRTSRKQLRKSYFNFQNILTEVKNDESQKC